VHLETPSGLSQPATMYTSLSLDIAVSSETGYELQVRVRVIPTVCMICRSADHSS